MKELEMEEEEEFFDLGTINEYEMLSNEDGSVLIQENCVAIKHIESSVIKMLPLTEEVLQALGLALVMDEESKLELEQKVKTELLQSVEDLERLPSQETLEQMHSQELEQMHSHESLGQVHSQESLEQIPSEDTFEQEASEQERYQEVLEREAIEQLDFEEAIEQQQFEHSEQPLEEHVDVEAEIDKLAIANATNSEALVWSSSMVNLLLDMYEKYQKDFAAGAHRHRALWKLIHQQMSAVHPELRRCSESHLQGKFGGLKRTYRGALDYLKNNLHTTNWPYFARMDKIMRSKYEMEEKQRIWSESANTSDTIEAKWVQSWTPLLLDAHSALLPTRSLAGHWARVCAAMARVDPRCARLQPAQVRRHYRQLQARRETHDPDVAEKLLKIQAVMSEQRGQAGAGGAGVGAEEEGAGAEGEGAGAEEQGAGVEGQGAAAEEEGAEGAVAAQAQASGTDVNADAPAPAPAPWRADCVTALLEEWASARAARGAGAAAAGVAATLRRRLAAPGRPVDWITGAAVGNQIRKLRHEYLLHSEKDPDSVEWPFFKAARAAFAVAGGAAAAAAAAAAGGWTRAATRRLLQLYAEVAADLDDSGPRFWAELAARLQRGEHGMKVSQRGCEMKMQQLCAQYQAMRSQQQSMRSQPDRSRDAEPWTYFEQMHRIFSEKAGPSWPNKTVQMLLAIYQREMTRFDCGDDPATVWRDISTAVSAFSHKDKGAPLTPEECRDTMLQLKQKYCKLLRDDEAAKAWPLYKRMSELFSSPLWSKNNVNLLLDVYEEYKERLSSAESASQSAVWREVSAQVNARSASACVSAGHCRAELHVLRARHRAAAPTAPAAPAAPQSALQERMNKIFGPEFESVNIKQDRSPTIANGDVDHKEVKAYTWTDASIHHLLELYARHQPEFRSQPRHVVWARIDAGLKLRDPHYSPVKKGSGAWFKYLEIMTKYLDIKEKRSNEKDWPFYDRMEAIFSKQKSAALGEAVDAGSEGEGAADEGAAGEGAEGEGGAGSPRRSPVAELETLLCAPRRARKRMIGDTDFAGVFLREAVPEKTPTKQTKAEATPIEEVTALQLLDLYAEHRLLLQAPSTSATLNRSKQKAWQRIARRMQAADPAFDRSGEDCKALVEGMEARYRKMKINRRLVPIAQRLTVKVYQKIESVLEQSNKDTKYTPTKPEMENHHVTTVEEGDVLQSLLQEIKRRNDLAEKRNSLLQKQNEQKRLHHAETIDMMSNILQALSNPVGEVNGSDVLNMLEKTMEEIHK